MRVARAGASMRQHCAVGDQVVRCGIGDGGGHDVAGPDVGTHRAEMHKSAVACAAGHPGCPPVLAPFSDCHQQLNGAADLRGVLLQRDPLLKVDESLIAFLHNGFRELSIELGRRCAGSLRILEGERRAEPGGGDHIERVLEVLLGLAGEPDDQIGGDCGMRDGGAHLLEDRQVAVGAVRAAHGPQHPVRTRLHRHMKGRADIRCLRHRLDDVVGELGRVRRGEPHPLEPVDPPACAQQLRERPTVAWLLGVGERNAVGVDVLTEKRHLEDALVDEGLDLGQHVTGPAVHLLAA